MNEKTEFDGCENLDTQAIEQCLTSLDEVDENLQNTGVDISKTQNSETESAESAQENNEINEQKIGKFKNPQELLRAYSELEKEFTKRSQKLKALESGKSAPVTEGDFKVAVDKFFTKIPSAKAFAKDIANEILLDPSLKNDANCLDVALLRVLTDKFRTPEQLMEDGQFLNDYVFRSEKVRDAIVADYLDGVRKGSLPYTLHGDGMQCVAPKVKPKSIEEAGFMFLKNNK